MAGGLEVLGPDRAAGGLLWPIVVLNDNDMVVVG